MTIGERVVNGSFEVAGAGGADVVAWWSESYGSDSTGLIERTSTTSTDGTYSLKITASAAGGYAGVTQYIKTAPSVSLTLSLDTKGNGTHSARYAVYDATNSAWIIATTSAGNTTTSWATTSVTVTVPATCTYLRLYIQSPAQGTGGVVYVDNISLTEAKTQMPTIRRFGDTWATAEELPIGAASIPHGAGRGISSLLTLPGGGSYDWGRSDVEPVVTPRSLALRGYWVSSSKSAMIAKAANLNALLGVRSKLWRDHGAGLHTQWHWARCVEVNGDVAHDQQLANAEYQIVFELDAGPWHGTSYTTTTTLTTTSTTIVCPNYGNAAVTDVTITVDPGGANITNLGVTHWVEKDSVLVGGLTDWDYTGTIAVGTTLILDAEAATVEVDSVGGYANLVLSSNHKIAEWLYLPPGYNALVVARTGGTAAATIEIAYEEGWY